MEILITVAAILIFLFLAFKIPLSPEEQKEQDENDNVIREIFKRYKLEFTICYFLITPFLYVITMFLGWVRG